MPTLYPEIAELILNADLNYINFLAHLIGIKKPIELISIEPKDDKNHIENYFISNNLPIGKTVIICPDNNTHKEFSNEIWLDIINIINECRLIPCINNSGTLNLENSFLSKIDGVHKIKIKPQNIVTTCEVAGSYIGGTNGFITVQSLFNKSSPGIHLINLNEENKFVKDKFNNILEPQYCKHENLYHDHFKKLQLEILVENKINKDNYKLIKEFFKIVSDRI